MNDLLHQPGLRPCPIEDVLVRDKDGWRFKDGVQYSFCNPDGTPLMGGGDPVILYGDYPRDDRGRIRIHGEPVGAWTDGERRSVIPFPCGFCVFTYDFRVSAYSQHIDRLNQPAILVVCRDVLDPDSLAIRREIARPFVLWREDVVR